MSGNVHCPGIRFSDAKSLDKPFFHYEPGSWNTILGSEPYVGLWLDWDRLAQVSRKAILEKKTGVFSALTTAIPGLSKYVLASHDFRFGCR